MNNRVPRRYSYVLGGTSMHFPNLFMICLFRWSKQWSQRLKKKTKNYWRVGLGGGLAEGSGLPLEGWVFGLYKRLAGVRADSQAEEAMRSFIM